MVRDSFKEALFDSVVPVMEKAHAQIFRQINTAFQNGTKECKWTLITILMCYLQTTRPIT